MGIVDVAIVVLLAWQATAGCYPGASKQTLPMRLGRDRSSEAPPP